MAREGQLRPLPAFRSLLFYDGWSDCEIPNTLSWLLGGAVDGGAPFTLTRGSKMLGSTGVGKASILGFQMLGVPSTAGPHRAPDGSSDCLKLTWIGKGREVPWAGTKDRQQCGLCAGVWVLPAASGGTWHYLLWYLLVDKSGGHLCGFSSSCRQTGPRT